MTGRDAFLVVEPQMLVQVDLSQAILELSPSAILMTALSTGQALSFLERAERLTGAIVGIGAEALKRSGLATQITRRGGWIICLNGRHVDNIRNEGWYPLPRPFSSDDARAAIAPLLEREDFASLPR